MQEQTPRRRRLAAGVAMMLAGALGLAAAVPASADTGSEPEEPESTEQVDAAAEALEAEAEAASEGEESPEAAQLAQVPGNPPGNNGTVKIDDVEFDDHPNNEPHVGCVFQVDFYGYDEGELYADVTFRIWPPTGNGQILLQEKDIFIGEDDNSGGGSEAGLDASRTYDLSEALAAYEPHPQQGWHVRLTVRADGSQGADRKHKTFWVQGCEEPEPTTTTTEGETTTTEGEGTTTTVEEATTTTEGVTTTEVSRKGRLPVTGSTTLPLVLGGALLLGAGGALVAGSKRLRRD